MPISSLTRESSVSHLPGMHDAGSPSQTAHQQEHAMETGAKNFAVSTVQSFLITSNQSGTESDSVVCVVDNQFGAQQKRSSELLKHALPPTLGSHALDGARLTKLEQRISKLYEKPCSSAPRRLSDASQQKKRTSSRLTNAMLPSSHAKTVAIARLDFIEDTMSVAVIEVLELYKLKWTERIDQEVLCQAMSRVLDRYLEVLAPITTSIAPIGVVIMPIRPQPAPLEFWETYRFLAALYVKQEQQRALGPLLVPTSLARFLKTHKGRRDIMQALKFDAARVLRDYEKFELQPWGR